MSLAIAEPARVVNRGDRGKPRASSTIQQIERARKERGISQGEFLRRANVHHSTWQALLRGSRPRHDTLKRLEAALDAAVVVRSVPVIVALYRLIMVQLAARHGIAETDALTLKFCAGSQIENLRLAVRLRQAAIYVLTVELEIPNAELGRAIGCTRQNIKKARMTVEDRRESDTELDALIARIASIARAA